MHIIHSFQVAILHEIMYNHYRIKLKGDLILLRYKMDILEALKKVGFTSYKIRKDKLIGEAQMQKIRTGEIASKETLNMICKLLNVQPGDILEYISDDDSYEQESE